MPIEEKSPETRNTRDASEFKQYAPRKAGYTLSRCELKAKDAPGFQQANLISA
jgi:hypothetical protein